MDPPERRPPLAEALEWSSRITTVALEMVVPAVLGWWVDQKLGTVVVFVVLGAAVGMTTAIVHLLRMTSAARPGDGPGGETKESTGSDERKGP